MLRIILFLIPYSLFLIPSSAQVFDSIQSSFHKKPQFTGGFGTKNTFIDGFRSPIFTVRIGLDFEHKIKTGAGISWLNRPRFELLKDNTPFYLEKILNADTVYSSLRFWYLNLFLEYVYFRTEKWEFSIPIQFGIGDSRYKYNYNGEVMIENEQVILLYEPAASGQYKITKWFGAGFGAGYRIMLLSNKRIGSRFNSPVYDIKVIVFWGELYRAVFKKKG